MPQEQTSPTNAHASHLMHTPYSTSAHTASYASRGEKHLAPVSSDP